MTAEQTDKMKVGEMVGEKVEPMVPKSADEMVASKVSMSADL